MIINGSKMQNIGNMIPFLLYFLLTSIYFIATPLRTFGIFEALLLTKFFLPIVMGAMFLIWITKLKKILFKDKMTFLLTLMFFQSLLVGVLRGNDRYYLISDLFTLFAAFFTYSFSSTIAINFVTLRFLFKIIANCFLIVGGLVIGIDYFLIYFLGMEAYFSFGESYLLFPFCYYLFHKLKFRFYLTTLLIFFGGRVGLLLACGGSFFIYYLLSHNYKVTRKTLLFWVVIILLTINALMYTIKDYQPNTGFLSNVLTKLQNYNYFHYATEYNDLENYGAGRVAEIINSMQAYSALPGYPYLSGSGAGFVYDLEVDHMTIVTHNVHFSILNIIEKYGLPLTIMFYSAWISLLYQSYAVAYSLKKTLLNNVFGVIGCFCIGMFVFSFTAFTVFIELFPWFFLGFINNSTRNEVNKNICVVSSV